MPGPTPGPSPGMRRVRWGDTMPATARIILALLMAGLLAGCNSTEATLDPSAAQPDGPAALTPGTTVVPAPAAPGSPPANAALANARVQFAPIVGSTVSAVTPLSRRLTLRARETGIRIVPAGDPATTHLVKSYFSAFSEKGETRVIYVWDIMDGAGNRLTRIQGEERVPGGGADPWSVVPAATMEGIGDRLMGELTTWITTHPA